MSDIKMLNKTYPLHKRVTSSSGTLAASNEALALVVGMNFVLMYFGFKVP